MGLIEQARADFEAFTSDSVNAFAVPITFSSPTGIIVTVNGIHTKHHLGLSEEGEMVNAKKASLTVSEQLLTAQNYPVRNSQGSVNLAGHQVKVADSTGTLCTYAIREWFPDEALGLITCILGDFQ
jgi:hypothetical protein